MAFLKFEKTLKLRKATISLWFRVPQATANLVPSATQQFKFEVFNGMIPLVVFGKQIFGDAYDATFPVVGYQGSPPQPVFGSLPIGPISCGMSPTFIGVEKHGAL